MAEATLTAATPKQLGKQLRAVRRRKGLSLSEVARGAGLSRRELVAYERGKATIPESDLWVLAGSCGVDVGELMPSEETPALSAAPASIEDSITQLRSGQEDYALNRHLDTLSALRALPPGSQVQLQDRERESMIEALGGDAATIEHRLMERLRINRAEAARLRELILPASPRYTPLALDAPDVVDEIDEPVEVTPEPEPATAADAAPAPEPAPVPEPDPWFGDRASRDLATPAAGPVDVFEELARLPEPVPLADHDGDVADLLAPPPEPVQLATAGGWQSYRSALPQPVEPVLVDAPVAAAATTATAHDAPPIEVAARVDETSWTGAAWGVAAASTGGPGTTAPPTTSGPPAWEPPPVPWEPEPAWSSETTDPGAPWTPEIVDPAPSPVEQSTPAPVEVVEIVEFVDEYAVEEPVPAPETHNGFEPEWAAPEWTTPEPAAFDAPADLGPWEHQPDPAATSTGFYVDWGTADDDAPDNSPAPSLDGPDDTPAPSLDDWYRVPLDTEVTLGFDTSTSEAPDLVDPTPESTPETPWGGLASVVLDMPVEPNDVPGGWESSPPVTADTDLAPISWRPLTEARTGDPEATDVDADPREADQPDEQHDPAAPEDFAVAGAEWDLGNAVPLVEIQSKGGLVMRRADERWALADLSTAPDFALEVDVDFRSGPGFGVLFHASTDDTGRMSGYSFDVDPIHEGGSYLVRQWNADRELWNPIARVPAADPTAMHGTLLVRIVVVDDELSASVNGADVLSVPSLSQACADRNRQPATGNRVGIQAWSSSDLVIDTLRVAKR